MATRRLRLLSANIQAGSSTRGYRDYLARSWSHVLPAGNKRGALDSIAALARQHDIVGLQEADPGSLRSGFTNQTHYLAERAGFAYWSHQPNRRVGGVASSANGLLSRLPPVRVEDHPLPGRVKGRGVLLARFGGGDAGLLVAIAHLSLGAQSRRAQLDFIAELLAEAPHAVLMGDFNMRPGEAEYDEMTGAPDTLFGRRIVAHHPVDASRLAGPAPEGSVSWVDLSGAGQHARLDYCFVSAGLAARVSDTWIDADADGSDHQPVWTVLE